MTLKKIISIILVICMLGCFLSLTACNKDENKNNENNENNENSNNGDNGNVSTDKTYTVTVLDGENNPVEGVKLIVTDNKAFPNATTDKDGKASVTLAGSSASVMILSVPKGYVKPESTIAGGFHGTFAKDSTELTLKVEKEASNKATYTVKVVDQNGDAVVGIDVQLCYNRICAASVKTDENGEMTSELNAGTVVDVKLYEKDGYTLPAYVKDSYHAVIEGGETSVTVVVTKN